ncbi:MAG: DUF3857 domain-containing protein [Methylococcales bacterium]
MRILNFTLLFLLHCILVGNTFAAEPFDKSVRNYYTYTINPDGSYILFVEAATTLLNNDAQESVRQQTITYSTSAERSEVVEVYTKKADGKRIEVPKSNFQLEVNSGKDNASPAFSDQTTLTIIFPELAVGDTIYFSYKITRTEPLFPNQFSEWQVFSKYYVYDDVRIKIDMPESMPARYELYEFTEKKPRQKNGRKIFEWAYQNKKPIEDKNNQGNVYEFGRDPGFLISTFPSHASIAQAYGVRAKQRAAVTARIQKLADEITKGKKTTYDQAKALYEWVAENISYAGHCIGVGAVVPRGTDFVLDNKMGDCKDHATLLEALLAAKKISSTQALINSGSIYNLPKIPVVSMVNHVMNYIPSLSLYVDATSESTPFGLLPDGESGKPILLVDGHLDGIKTPVQSDIDEKSTVQANIKIGEDGSAKGNIVWTNKGRSGLISNMPKNIEKYKAWISDKEKAEEYSKETIKRIGFDDGKVSLNYETAPERPDVARAEVVFDVKGFINTGSLGAFNVGPIFSASSIYSSIRSTKSNDAPSSAFTCYGAHVEETYTYELPANLKILAVPDNFSVSNALVSFQASYALKGNLLTVLRKFDDVSQGPVCEPNVYKSYKEIAEKAMPNLKSQIVYKYI